MPHPIAAPINHKALSQRARDIRAWLRGFLKWALRELSRPSALIPRLLIDGAPALRVAERELRELILCEALSRFSRNFPRRDARGDREPTRRDAGVRVSSLQFGSLHHPFPDWRVSAKSGTHKLNQLVIMGPGRDASHRSGDGWRFNPGAMRSRPRARVAHKIDPRNAPRGFRFSRVRMSATRQLTRGVLPKLRETTPYARAERLARVSEKIEFYANALLARLKSDARACSLIMIAPPAPALFSNAPRLARAAADTS